jgi:hypothetical protein
MGLPKCKDLVKVDFAKNNQNEVKMRQLAIPQLYRSIHTYLLQRIPDTCDSRLTNMIYLMMGIFSGRSVQLNLLVRKLPIQAKKLSRVRRLSRFLDNPAVQVRRWYAPFAKALLEAAAVSGQVRLIIDASKVAFGYRLLMVSVAYRRRSLPLAWTWVAGTRGHSPTRQQLALLNYVRTLLPPMLGYCWWVMVNLVPGNSWITCTPGTGSMSCV